MVKLPIWPSFVGAQDIDLKLERVKKLLNLVDNPERKIKNIIHVAGTNGKGSTSAFLRSFLRAAGYSVNLYTSPHLVNFNERISLNGQDITDKELNKLSRKYQKIVAQAEIKITFFEATTIMAIDAFAQHQADYNIIEVGLGGRLDATNIFTQKLAAIITPIALDHQEFLGAELIKIAKEKAGIILKNTPIFLGKQRGSVKKMIFDVAKVKNCPINYYTEYKEKIPSNLGLNGRHQRLNFKLAALAFKHLTNQNIAANYHDFLSWPARLQDITQLCKKKYDLLKYKLFLDGGHNEDAAKALKVFIAENNISHIILAMVKRKDINKFIQQIKSTKLKIYLTEISNNQESVKINDLTARLAVDAIFPNYKLALEAILAESNYKNLLMAGSLFFAAEILADLSDECQ